jgi:hypothetical protein
MRFQLSAVSGKFPKHCCQMSECNDCTRLKAVLCVSPNLPLSTSSHLSNNFGTLVSPTFLQFRSAPGDLGTVMAGLSTFLTETVFLRNHEVFLFTLPNNVKCFIFKWAKYWSYNSKGKQLYSYIIIPNRSRIVCGLVVRVPGYRSRGPGSIPGATKFSEK